VKSYADLGAKCGIEYCPSCPNGDHHKGWSEPSVGRVHFSERAVTRAGMRNFLKLVGAIYYRHNRGQPRWRMIYEQNRYAYGMSREWGLQIPSRLSATDRALVEDDLMRSGDTDARALTWARRRR
jgi:hypothetical protein